MTAARDIMHTGAACIQEAQTLEDAARKVKELDVGALPICGEDDRLHGIITDRDIVVKCLAKGKAPRTVTAGQLGQGKPVTVDADAETDRVLQVMQEHRIRRLPVIEDHRLVSRGAPRAPLAGGTGGSLRRGCLRDQVNSRRSTQPLTSWSSSRRRRP
ncbi:CBS domain-containing protein [Streptomyces sp. NPDC052107]|uniref:CBS domain-containing protein n=1 Tax=Streptomyces sp. NPDC052107 TaxID=3155632 RepID=UPI0034209283